MTYDLAIAAAVVLDAGGCVVFAFFAVTAWRLHEGRVRRRVVVSAALVTVTLAGGAALRFVYGPVLPIWYLPLYVMMAPVMAYAFIVHTVEIRTRIRAAVQRQARRDTADVAVQARQP